MSYSVDFLYIIGPEFEDDLQMSNYGNRDMTSVVGPGYEPINFLQHNYVAIGFVFLLPWTVLASAYNDYNDPWTSYSAIIM